MPLHTSLGTQDNITSKIQVESIDSKMANMLLEVKYIYASYKLSIHQGIELKVHTLHV